MFVPQEGRDLLVRDAPDEVELHAVAADADLRALLWYYYTAYSV